MIDTLSSVTSTAVGVALDGLAQRQQLIAANLANANATNYTVRDLSFESALRHALDGHANAEESVQVLLRLKHDLNQGAYTQRTAAQSVEMDAEMLRLNETVIRYQALIEGLGKYGSLTRMAIAGEVKG